MADLNKLVEKIKSDAELKKQFAAAVKKDNVAEFCKSLGIETTKEEVKAFLQTKKSELNERDLKKVSGGCDDDTAENVCDAFYSTVTFGTMCAAESIYYGIVEGTSCLKESSEL